MFLTNVLLAGGKKNPWVLMAMKSVASGHRRTVVRLRTEARDLMILFDPLIQRDAVYKDLKKLKSMKYLGRDYQHKL